MPDEPTNPPPDPTSVPPGDTEPRLDDAKPGRPGGRIRGRRRRLALHLSKRASALVIATVAAALVSVLAIDLGPSLRGAA